MKISTDVQLEYLDHLNIDTSYPEFPYYVQGITFKKGDKYRSEIVLPNGSRIMGIYERSGPDLTPPVVDSGVPSTTAGLALGTVAFDKLFGALMYVQALDGSVVPKNPNFYNPAVPFITTQSTFGSWTHRYVELGDLSSTTGTLTFNSGTSVHKLTAMDGYFNHSVTYNVTYDKYVPIPLDSDNRFNNYQDTTTGRKWVEAYVAGALVYTQDYTTTSPTSFTGTDGETYATTGQTNDLEGIGLSYQLAIATSVTELVTKTRVAAMRGKAGTTAQYPMPVKLGADNTVWYAGTIILNGPQVFMYTGVSDTAFPPQTVTNTGTNMEFVYGPSKLEYGGSTQWGWTYSEPDNPYKPFDNKDYTVMEASGLSNYHLDTGGATINTIVLSKVIADSITVTFWQDQVNNPPITIKPANTLEGNEHLGNSPSTEIIYLPTDYIGDFTVAFSGNQIELGSIEGGMVIDLGFSNLAFSNKYVDLSPFEKDQWGNILYVDGVKLNIYSGTVDVPIHQYDDVNRIMRLLGKSRVVINGSDIGSNEVVGEESLSVFGATKFIGRIKSFALSTKAKGNTINPMATYSFQIEEDV